MPLPSCRCFRSTRSFSVSWACCWDNLSVALESNCSLSSPPAAGCCSAKRAWHQPHAMKPSCPPLHLSRFKSFAHSFSSSIFALVTSLSCFNFMAAELLPGHRPFNSPLVVSIGKWSPVVCLSPLVSHRVETSAKWQIWNARLKFS